MIPNYLRPNFVVSIYVIVLSRKVIENHDCVKCPSTEFFLVRIQSECGKIRNRKNSVLGNLSRRA